jgi:hypothetical protein
MGWYATVVAGASAHAGIVKNAVADMIANFRNLKALLFNMMKLLMASEEKVTATWSRTT